MGNLSLKLISAVICGPGCIRTQNQDNYYLDGYYRSNPNDNEVSRVEKESFGEGLYAVADGIGGEKHGELASLLAVSLIERESKLPSFNLLRYVMSVNDEISKLSDRRMHESAGTTFTGLYLENNRAEIVNIGDSRAYQYRNGQLTRLTTDHTVIGSLVNAGLLSEEQARHHRDRHRLTQFLGIPQSDILIEPESMSFTVEENDRFLLCSDGLYEMVSDAEMANILRECTHANESVRQLFNLAMQAGGNDNITALIVQVKKQIV